MGKDCRSWLYQQHSSWELLNKSNPPDQGPQDGHPVGYPAYASPYISVAKFPAPKFVAPNNSHLRSCQNPQQACSWALQSAIRQGMFSVAPHTQVPNAELTNVKKRFLVFDQTGNETTMFFGSINPPPNPNQIHLKSFQSGPVTRDSLEKLGSREWDQTDISDGEDRNGSMQEDTEELDALLYSDEEETEDEEEASTGHSPFEIPQFKKREVTDDLNDVAISFPTKRRRLSEDSQDEALTDTASSGNPLTEIWNFEDADESSCNKGSGRKRHQALPSYDATAKQVRKEKIQETLGVLSSIIPGGNGKDAAVVLDEAIRYLKSLRLKAKALGVGSLV